MRFTSNAKKSKLDELFSNLIELLKKLVDSEEIDSIVIKTTLERIIATLSKHNTASYFSLFNMTEISQNLIKNIVWEQLKSIPGLGAIIKGVEKTVKDSNIEMGKLQNDMHELMKKKFDSDYKMLEYKSSKLLEK